MVIKSVRPAGANSTARPTSVPSQLRPTRPQWGMGARPAIRPGPTQTPTGVDTASPVPAPAHGEPFHVEVDDETHQARLAVAQDGFEKAAAGYSTTRESKDAHEVIRYRGLARRLDERLERLREKEEDQEESAPVEDATLPPMRGGDVVPAAADHPESGPATRGADPSPDDLLAPVWDSGGGGEAETWGEESGVDGAPDEAPDDVDESPEPWGETIAAVDIDDPVDGEDEVLDEVTFAVDLAENGHDDDAPSAPKFGPIGPRNQSRGEFDDFLDACIIVDDEIRALLGVEDDDRDARFDAYLDDLHVGDSPEAKEYAARVQEVLAEIRADAAAESAVTLRTVVVPTASAAVPAPVFDFDSPRIRALVPPGYRLAFDGLFAEVDDGPPVRVTMQPVCVDGRVCSEAETSWALRVCALNPKRKKVELLVEMERLHSGKSAIAALANLGVSVLKPALFVPFLQLSSDRPGLPEIIGASRMGFASAPLADGASSLCFVLPGQTIYPAGKAIAEEVVLLPRAKASIHRAFRQGGTLEQWQALAEKTRGNALETFALALAFAAPLQPFSNTENGTVHMYGTTSRGKTLVLQLAATVFGNGAARVDGVTRLPTLVRTWHSTANALEAMIAEISGTLIIIDELGLYRARVSGYAQNGGKTKGRAKGSGGLEEEETWSSLILSSGEIPVSHQIASMGGGPMMGGEAVRMLDVPVTDLLPVGDPIVKEARKRECGLIFGTAGPALLLGVLNRVDGNALALTNLVTSQVDALRNQLCEEASTAARRSLHPEHQRAMRILALAGVAGRWAVEEGVLPHTEAEVLNSVRVVRDAWLGGQSFESDDERAISKVRDYVSRYRGQMTDTAAHAAGQRHPANCRGILHQGFVLLTPSNFRDACAGLHAESVARALKGAGILHTNDPGHLQVTMPIRALNIAKTRYYKLNFARLFGEEAEPDEADEGAGAGPGGVDPAGSV